MRVRPPAVAGRFYPNDPDECRTEATAYLAPAVSRPTDAVWHGGIVPHAGWICSAAVAGRTIRALAAQHTPDVVVVFGAVHTPIYSRQAALDSHPRWAMPLGDAEQEMDLNRMLAASGELFTVDDRFHSHEHAIEVEIPLIQLAWPKAKVLPIEVPLVSEAVQIGRETARRVSASGTTAIYLASTDLTHYGPSYRFTPAGVGPRALEWAKDNDRRLLRLVTALDAEKIVEEVEDRFNACGGGAVAALVAACRELGATRAEILYHTNSYEALASVAPQTPDNAVGYASAVIG